MVTKPEVTDIMPRALLDKLGPNEGLPASEMAAHGLTPGGQPKQTLLERQEAKAKREAAKLGLLRVRSQARVDLELARKMLLAGDYETALERAQCAVRELAKLVPAKGEQP